MLTVMAVILKSSSRKHFNCLCVIVLVTDLTKTGQAIFTSDEPDYRHMLYGGVWKHVLFNPPDNMPDVIQARKHLLHFLEAYHKDTAADDFSLRCFTKLDLWFTLSDAIPLTITKFMIDSKGLEHPVSVPVSLGSTYNFQLAFTMNESVTVHLFTITKSLEMEIFYIYAHTFYEMNIRVMNKHLDQCHRLANAENKLDNLQCLSNLARNKGLEVLPGQECGLATEVLQSFSGHDQYKPQDLPQKAKDSSHLTEEIEGQPKETVLKVMSYNIWNFNTYHHQNSWYPQRLSRISELLKDVEPDIVAFQEVRLETPLGGHLGPSQMDHLKSVMLQYQFVFQPAQLQRNSLEQGRTEEGVAIFSKFPIIYHDYLLLFRNQSNSADQNQRVCLHAVISVPFFGKVHVFNTHLSLSHEAREVAVKQIMDYMSYYSDGLVIFVGDLNATPEEKAIRLLTSDSGLVDVWDHLYAHDQGFTFSSIEEKLSKRIDYIFMKKTDGITPLKMEVLPDKKRSEAASDHRAVMASFGRKHNGV